jgi:hypothetical protein
VIRGMGHACAAPVQGGGNEGVVSEVGESPVLEDLPVH